MTDPDVHGPIDFVLLEMPGTEMKGEVAAELLALVERGTIRLFDLLVVRKEQDGSYVAVEVDATHQTFGALAGARSGLLSDEDVAAVAAAMDPDTVAALVVYENSWAVPLVSAASRAGAQLVASVHIPAADVIAALDALETVG